MHPLSENRHQNELTVKLIKRDRSAEVKSKNSTLAQHHTSILTVIIDVLFYFRLPWIHQWVVSLLHGLLPGCGK